MRQQFPRARSKLAIRGWKKKAKEINWRRQRVEVVGGHESGAFTVYFRIAYGLVKRQFSFCVFPARRRISGRCIFCEKSRVRIKLVITRLDEYNDSGGIGFEFPFVSFPSILESRNAADLCSCMHAHTYRFERFSFLANSALAWIYCLIFFFEYATLVTNCKGPLTLAAKCLEKRGTRIHCD